MGDNYGLNDTYDYLELELDSLDATTSNSAGSAATDWPRFFVAAKGPIERVAAIKILDCQIPFSWYVFNDVNNTFVLTEQGSDPVTVTLPVGNYTSDEVATNLQNALRILSPNSFQYVVTYYENLNKMTIYNGSSDNIPFTFTFGAGPNTPYPNSGNKNPRLWIGFPPGDTTSQTFQGGDIGNQMITPNCLLTSGPNYLYLNSNEIGSQCDVYLPTGAVNLGGGLAGPQIAKISVADNSNGVIFWEDPDPQKWFTFDTLRTLSYLDLYLSLGNTTSQIPLQLNGLSFSVKLGILRRRENKVGFGNSTVSNGRVATRTGPVRIGPTY